MNLSSSTQAARDATLQTANSLGSPFTIIPIFSRRADELRDLWPATIGCCMDSDEI